MISRCISHYHQLDAVAAVLTALYHDNTLLSQALAQAGILVMFVITAAGLDREVGPGC